MPNDFLPIVYAAYASVSVALTVFLARTLGRNGRVFLLDVFPENVGMADAVNQLLVVGFYLVNFGYACLLLRGGAASNLTPFEWNTKKCDASGAPTGSAATGLNATEKTNFTATVRHGDNFSE